MGSHANADDEIEPAADYKSAPYPTETTHERGVEAPALRPTEARSTALSALYVGAAIWATVGFAIGVIRLDDGPATTSANDATTASSQLTDMLDTAHDGQTILLVLICLLAATVCVAVAQVVHALR
ncbi:hypothetical protein ACFO1B_48560 [Dactylosporangium siamense]|uniref:Uncharacterized protein n=1 Tax=Dactylosporangium siamense TaxID=685454 RepID=A0A919UE58_9ACTN|nr:hypothetical protein [Dactylosporangium siamense]GIG52212.1 hypothetical protein Dsi01nite_102530 [Dactylosporangium siamense]